MEGLNSTVNTSSILLSQLDSLVKELKKDLSDERSSSLLDDIIQLTENLSAVEMGNDKDAELTSRIRASGIALWNRAVSLKTQDSTNAQLVARMRHVACNLTFTASREEESKAVIKKKLAMAMKTGRAWLDVHNPTMADSALELAEECLEKLEKEIPSSSDQSTTKQDTSTEDQRNSFRVKCFRAEAALALSDEEKAWIYFQKAKERLHQLPQEVAIST
ncbi:testis-expressed protein 11-like [Corticium candelabrum]|uniref:testis-expressed protein 11-like n=1 Tax=Corticium candelabrum TaxID=121492 RepID=UPI002E267104|nr:testis-expressed protein 11-like [Corticium candelabrum]